MMEKGPNKTGIYLSYIKKTLRGVSVEKRLVPAFILLTTILILLLSIKGPQGSSVVCDFDRAKFIGGPFESTNNTSRYALTYAIVEEGTFFLNDTLACFATPDVARYRGKFFSIFTPGISFIGVPFYILGKLFGSPQIFTYLSTSLFAVLNVLLIARVAIKLGARYYSALLSGFIFLFATNAFPYALTLTQHHVSVTIILLAILSAFDERTLLNNIWFGLLSGFAILVDIPNVIMMFPIGLYILAKHFQAAESKSSIALTLKTSIVGIIIGLLPVLAIYGWYNYRVTGSFAKIGQTVGRSKYFEVKETKRVKPIKQGTSQRYGQWLPFNTRNQVTGFNVLLLGYERSWIYYSPIVLIGVLGLFLVYKKREKKDIVVLVSSVAFTNVVAYSMFFDPWGGWSYGPRYLIPAAAILCSGVGIALERYKRNYIFFFLTFVLGLYSLGVSILGGFTTTQIPPKVEAVNLVEPIPYTYKYNLQLVEQNFSSSLIYNRYLSSYLPLNIFLFMVCALAIGVLFLTYTAISWSGPTRSEGKEVKERA